ncbi:MAG TPA: polynucleotide kinase-phosphatase [Bacteroidetes bacterium]|nr:polynucleotide kinase-phosphatase [Bacteroidota bacterium]HCN38233.1 polynucleotide kinase-phosphatase [Bacteroidota bacterium]
MEIRIPEISLVVLIGVSGSGKSSFAKKLFKKTEVISSDYCRALISDDETNQKVTTDAFELLYFIAGKRLKDAKLTVIDATNVQKESRKGLINLARTYHCIPVAIVLDIPEKICEDRNKNRADRNISNHIIRKQSRDLKRSIKDLNKEGFRKVYVLKSEEEINSVNEIILEKLYNNKKDETGPFDIIGDIHGCYTELEELLIKLGYKINTVSPNETNYGFELISPENRKVIFVGDLVDRGPDSPKVLKLVMSMVNSGIAYCVQGNHDFKLQKYLSGKKVQLKNGLDITAQQLESETNEFKKNVEQFLYNLISHYVFDNGKLVVAHAGIKEEMQGRGSGAVRTFCLYGETTGETDEFGLPVRYNWAKEYRGNAKVVYGHTPVTSAEWINNTIDIDTGCVFGGKLTALRYPEEELISVNAKKVYYEPLKKIENPDTEHKITNQQEYDDLLEIEDVTGKRIIQTRLKNNITIKEENSIAALEVMSRFAINPKWLIYLPPTMSPCKTSSLDEYLEHPQEAIDYYKERGVKEIVCEEKHMGSRAIFIICKDEKTVKERFGILNEGIGVCYTRTGRKFFNDDKLEIEFINRINSCLTNSNFWQKFNSDWVCIDAEIMPWSAKAQELLKSQYASVGSAGKSSLSEVIIQLKKASERNILDINNYLEHYQNKFNSINKFINAYQNYCWSVLSINDYRVAPFHILATEGKIHTDKNHIWHMENISDICNYDTDLLQMTNYQSVPLDDQSKIDKVIDWWISMTNNGGEGMVVKPFDFISSGKNGLIQPAVKCRGREYLRIIYGPEYDSPENMKRLKSRNTSRKQSLALKEFALSIEALERFIRKEPLRRIHESVFGILALESEEIDPRL